MHGGDVAALRALGGALRRRELEIVALERRLSALVERASWAGPDRVGFVDEWRRHHAPSLSGVAAELGDAASRAHHHADRQEWASRAADRRSGLPTEPSPRLSTGRSPR